MVDTKFPTRFGKYILLDRLNSGGMAEVYRAKVTGAEKFQRLVAIKCMLPALIEDEQFITMFVDEAKLAAHLSHANIVQIYELGRLDERLYISMELVHGRDLRHIIKRMRAARIPVPIGFAAYVIAKAAEGLDFAHRKPGVDGSPMNLVHRDVSPQNVLVSYDGEVKVVDFGIAKAEVRDTETRAGVLKGKFAYMAPEQVMGGEIDRRADIFALGSLLYEVMTGQKLFRGESDFSILEKVREAKVPALADIIPDVPPEIDAVLHRAMAKDPADRYEYASDFAEDLTPLLIQERSIFGTKQAKEFMQTLYAEDIAFLGEQLKRYAQIRAEDCIETSDQRQAPRESEVFDTTFDDAMSLADGGEGYDDETGAEVTKRGGRGSDQQSSGWTEMHDVAAFGEEMSASTELFKAAESIPREAAGRPEPPGGGRSQPPLRPQPALRPQPYDDSLSAPASGLRSGVSHAAGGLSKPIFNGLVAASVVLLAAVLAVFLYTRYGPTATSTQTFGSQDPMIVPLTETPATVPPAEPESPPTSVLVGSGIDRGIPDPALAPDGTDDPDPGAVRAPPAARKKRGSRKGRSAKAGRGGKVGYVTIQIKGAKNATIEVDGKDAGYAPLVYYKLRTGKHRLRVTEDGGTKTKVLDVIVEPSSRKNAAKMIVDLSR